MSAVTILETPPMVLFGIKIYQRDEYGLKCVDEIVAKNTMKELTRKICIPKEGYDFDAKMKEVEGKITPTTEVRALFHTQPYKSSVPRVKPDIIEIKVSGGANGKERFEFAKGFLGQEIRARDMLETGSLIDVIAVTKGKGMQGVVKRYGIKMQSRKNRKGKRRVGSIGPWKPNRTMYTVGRSGQMGFHQRVEYHKRIMKISESPDEINPKGGFIRYGTVGNDYIMLMGSVPGPKKRLIRIRKTMRPVERYGKEEPKITYIAKTSQQRK